jgi:hypothetical protein
MKRSEALKLIANQLDFLNGSFSGVRTNFTESEIKNADVILTTLEHAGMMPPAKEGVIKIQELENGELCIPIWGWESEE